jgi:predicted glycoside hydrolase/deacetylase ChbG (UPF0249 family)
MPPKRQLIVNADDFGLSRGVNQGISHAHEHGILTSASLMVRYPAASEAAQYALTHPRLSIGLHVDLAEWAYRDGEWQVLYQVVAAEDAHAVEAEVTRQHEAFRRLLGRNPTHLDSHQHVHRSEPVLSILSGLAQKLSLPLRSFTSAVQYCGDFYGQTGEGAPYPEGISLDGLLQTLSKLPPGVSELGCHPGLDDHLDSVYRLERKQEVAVLCEPRVRATINSLGIELLSFADLARSRQPPAVL